MHISFADSVTRARRQLLLQLEWPGQQSVHHMFMSITLDPMATPITAISTLNPIYPPCVSRRHSCSLCASGSK